MVFVFSCSVAVPVFPGFSVVRPTGVRLEGKLTTSAQMSCKFQPQAQEVDRRGGILQDPFSVLKKLGNRCRQRLDSQQRLEALPLRLQSTRKRRLREKGY